MKKRLLITGISGLLGSNLAYCLKDRYRIVGWYHSQPVRIPHVEIGRVDMCDSLQVQEYLKVCDPDIVIHCAAQANVDFCEEKPVLSHQLNVDATKNLIKALNPQKHKLIYISTDLVYDGKKGQYKETDKVRPLNVYGKTKLQAEKIVSKLKNSLILRTNFFGFNIRQDKFSLGEWVIHALGKNHPILGFTDVRFSSIYTFDLAKIIDKIINLDVVGVFNCGSKNSISKYDFLRLVACKVGLPQEYVRPVEVDKADLKAKRSKNLSLNSIKLSRALGLKFPSIEESINRFLVDYKKGVGQKIHRFALASVYPHSEMMPYGRQSIDSRDIDTVVKVLKAGYLTQGPKVVEFERALSKQTQAAYAVAVNSGTAALHIACLAAGVKEGYEVITSPNSFVASANCAVYCGAKPVFADIDPRTYNISSVEIEKKITKKTKAIIPVHFAGQSCDMDAIKNIVKKKEKEFGHKIFIIEDASHALGSRYRHKPVGCCEYSDMVVMSFHPVKHITTGEGGVVFTNQEFLSRTLRIFRSHGITSDQEYFLNPPEEYLDERQQKFRWYYEQQLLGFNYRITDIQCALGLSQLKKLPYFLSQRRKIVNFYNRAFKEVPGITLPYEQKECVSNFHLYVLLLDFKNIGISRAEFMRQLFDRKILTQVHYIPIHTQPFYRKHFKTNYGMCFVAENYYQQCLSMPLFPDMSLLDAKRVVCALKEIIGVKA